MAILPPSLYRPILAVIVSVSLLVPTASASFLPSELPPTPFSEWQVEAGDAFIVDTLKNMGYLVHADGGYTTFLVATGQKRVVRYIGRIYDAKTPDRAWTALSKEKKGDRITFGKSGRFLRLSDNKDGERTPYGIHSHAYVNRMLSDTERFKSMGCIIVTEETLDTLEATFTLNDGRLSVITVNGFNEDYVTEPALRELISMTQGGRM